MSIAARWRPIPAPGRSASPKSRSFWSAIEDLESLASNPDKVLDLSLTPQPRRLASLRQVCESARTGRRTLIVAFDQFFQQYRPGQNHARRLMPDMDAYIEKIARVGKFAEKYGLGLELSLLTPLEIGKAYRQATGETGVWMQYRKGLRDPDSGEFSVQLWRHCRWVNNKGPFDLEDAGVRVFAFQEHNLPGTPYRVVPEGTITEITGKAQVEVLGGSGAEGFPALRIRVHGKGTMETPGLNRVLVVQSYNTPEMDYFSDKALPYLKGLVDRYADAGVKLNALYSDEPHLMGDWSYFGHHDHGQFAMRYVSPALATKFAARFGAKYKDFAKYLVYFAYGQDDFAIDLSATQGVMHVFGPSPQEIRRTALFRAHYYRYLQDGLTDLLVQAKRHAEARMGHRLEARAHATWAESPTCDYWQSFQGTNPNRSKYEYTSDFVWSNTVQQAAVACADYFRWGDFLTGNGNDHAEGGFLDRNYVGLSLACSTGILNEVPYSYAAHWGMPDPIAQRRAMLAVFVELLKEAKVRDGDTVAVSMTGSFPALNICLYSAITTLHLKPVVISSVASSQWGANNPSFLWIDMESVLEKKGLFSFRSSAASMGGRNDMAREMTAEGREMIVAGIRRNGLKMIVARNIPADIDERMKIYFDTPQAFPRAYINIGGGVASVGTRISRVLLKPGKLSELSSDIKAETVVYRFLTEKIPVIHVENIKEIAKQYGLPILPGSTPQAGEGQVYHGRQYNRWLAGSILAGILFGLYIFGRVDWGFRMLRASSHQETGPPEPMV